MDGGYVSYDPALKEGYDSTSDQEDETGPKPIKLYPCGKCNRIFRTHIEFIDHLGHIRCERDASRPQRGTGNRNYPLAGEAGGLRQLPDPLELRLGPPGSDPHPEPPSLDLTLGPSNSSRFYNEQVRRGNGGSGRGRGAGPSGGRF